MIEKISIIETLALNCNLFENDLADLLYKESVLWQHFF